MDKQCILIEKIIKLNSGTCPAIAYDNPLIDKNVARALSRSIIKVVTNPEQKHINKKLKESILTNFRKICLNQSKEHFNINDNTIEEFINSFIDEKSCDDEEVLCKKIDAFLITNLRHISIESKYKNRRNPETALALFNLTSDVKYLTEDLLFWDDNKKINLILENLWSNKNIIDKNVIDALSVRCTTFIEDIILTACTNIVLEKVNIEEILCDNNFKNLLIKCSISPKCFQITCNILNYLLIESKFNVKILGFIHKLISQIRLKNSRLTVFYQESLQSILMFLNMDISVVPRELINKVTRPTLDLLENLHETCEHDLILLLSHYPEWFNLYNNRKHSSPIPMELEDECDNKYSF